MKKGSAENAAEEETRHVLPARSRNFHRNRRRRAGRCAMTGERRAAAAIGLDVAGRIGTIDQKKLRARRLDRVRAELKRRDYMGCLLADPINIRYATGSRNMQVWTLHAPARWAFVPVVLYEFMSSKHVNDGIETIDEIRPSTPFIYFLAGSRSAEKATLCGPGPLMSPHPNLRRR